MSNPTREEVVSKLSSNIDEIKKFHVKRLGLFGSVARGEAGASSDADFVVEYEDTAFPKSTEYRGLFENHLGLVEFLRSLLGMDVDVIRESAIRARIRPYIEKDLILVIS